MNWLENMVLQTKLILLTAVMMIALAVLGYMGFNTTQKWDSSITEVGAVRLPSLVGIMDMRVGINQVVIQQNRVRGLEGDHDMVSALEDSIDKIHKGFERYEKGLKIYAPLPQTPEEAIEWKKLEDALAKWREMSLKFNTNVLEPLSRTKDEAMIKNYFAQMTPFILASRESRAVVLEAMDKIAEINTEIGNETVKTAQEDSKNTIQLTIIAIAIAFVIAIILATLIIRSIVRSITTSVTVIKDGAIQITSASDQISSSATSLAEGASNQASSVEEVSATVEQSTAINTQNAQNAKEADILAKDANAAATKGNDKIQNLMKSMEHISNSSNQISKIIKTINEIAFQTNLLALNAAVEAARAGEHGLGFAVVADEVKNLAGRSAQAAKETEAIIQSSIEQIKTGNEIASETNQAFAEILDKIKKTSNLIGEIAISAKEQSEGMNQIAQAMSTVDEVTQQNAATSEEAAAAAEELNAQANAMLESVAEIGAMVGVHVSLDKDDSHKGTKKLIAKPKAISKSEKKAISKVASKSKNNSEVFPLDESDLKEF